MWISSILRSSLEIYIMLDPKETRLATITHRQKTIEKKSLRETYQIVFRWPLRLRFREQQYSHTQNNDNLLGSRTYQLHIRLLSSPVPRTINSWIVWGGFWINPGLNCRWRIPCIRYVTNFLSAKGSGQNRSNLDFSSAYRAADSPISCCLALTKWDHSSRVYCFRNAPANACDQASSTPSVQRTAITHKTIIIF